MSKYTINWDFGQINRWQIDYSMVENRKTRKIRVARPHRLREYFPLFPIFLLCWSIASAVCLWFCFSFSEKMGNCVGRWSGIGMCVADESFNYHIVVHFVLLTTQYNHFKSSRIVWTNIEGYPRIISISIRGIFTSSLSLSLFFRALKWKCFVSRVLSSYQAHAQQLDGAMETPLANVRVNDVSSKSFHRAQSNKRRGNIASPDNEPNQLLWTLGFAARFLRFVFLLLWLCDL